jgi:hypothetical protein
MSSVKADGGCSALSARINALEKMLDEREARSQERSSTMKESVAAALASSEKAITKADTATEKRFDAVNEFRQTLSDQAKNFMTIDVYTVQNKNLSEKLDAALTRINTIEAKGEGKSTGFALVGAIIYGGVVGLSAVAALLFNLFNFLRTH